MDYYYKDYYCMDYYCTDYLVNNSLDYCKYLKLLYKMNRINKLDGHQLTIYLQINTIYQKKIENLLKPYFINSLNDLKIYLLIHSI